MATQTVNLPYDTSTAANYKSIMSQYGTALAAFGWVQTADTGQVTWGSVSTLPGNLTYRDYEVWRMADTAQATTPVYMKLEYSTQATNCPIIRWTIGTSSNGSGTITGTTLLSAQTVTTALNTSLGAANNFACYYSGGTGRFMALMYEGATGTNANAPFALSIERSKDSSGADTTEFVVVTVINRDGNHDKLVKVMLGSVVTSGENCMQGFYNPTTATNNFNGTTAACPQFVNVGKLSNPLLNFAFVPAGDAGEGATVTVNIYGSTHTYIVCKAGPSNQESFTLPVSTTNIGAGATLCRYE